GPIATGSEKAIARPDPMLAHSGTCQRQAYAKFGSPPTKTRGHATEGRPMPSVVLPELPEITSQRFRCLTAASAGRCRLCRNRRGRRASALFRLLQLPRLLQRGYHAIAVDERRACLRQRWLLAIGDRLPRAPLWPKGESRASRGSYC